MSKRKCGGCTLCCKLLPVKELNKSALTKCQHQRTGKGCKIYDRAPVECRLWSCQWLSNPKETSDLSRPDRSRYVIDILPDVIRLESEGSSMYLSVLQIWVDPNCPDAYRDPALLDYIESKGEDGMGAMIRYGSDRAIVLLPPSLTKFPDWIVKESILEESSKVSLWS